MQFSRKVRRIALGASALAGMGALAAPAGAVVINDNYTPDQVVDATNITGVGEMVTDEQNGYIGLCTATLINPRTVILASHCVNDLPGNGYGSATGGHAIGVGFQADNYASIVDWFGSGFQTNTTDKFYNGNYVTYNPHSLDLGPSNNFLQGDVAMISFDTPVTGVPTMDLLLSPLSGPTHVTIDGYGGNGIGTTGSDGSNIDFRRRVAENTLSVLGSLDDQDTFLFGSPDGLPQNLYMVDFNDPKFGTAAANPYDFDVFGDKALQKEGITAPGDSGGPLIVDQEFSKPVVAAVLSGGDSFYLGQPQASYGTTSFYQPLYLFWDWIVANNPYKYVSAKTGDGSWTDPMHWQIDLDPAYQVIGANGQLVNGLPTTPAAGIDGTSPKFGYVCDGANCEDIATGVTYPQQADGTPDLAHPNSSSTNTAKTTTASNDKGGVALASLNGTAQAKSQVVANAGTSAGTRTGSILTPQNGGPETSILTPQTSTPQQSTLTPQATIDPVGNPPPEGSATVGGEVVQGAPGSSNFVPNDTDGNPAANQPPRYYDVTLSADGTTTLSGANIVVDRFTLDGAQTGLTINSGAALASLIDTTVNAGVMTVNGSYVSVGDFNLNAGLLQGSGLVRIPYLTSLMGSIAPGGIGSIGTLTVQGNVVLSSATRLYMDIGPGGASDLLQIQDNPLLAAGAENGRASLGGLLALSVTSGYRYDPNQSYTLITASGGLTDGFDAASALSAILYPSIHQSANALTVTIKALPYSSVIDQSSGIQRAYAALLDRSRGTGAAGINDFYAQTDLMSQSEIQSSLEQAAPYPQQTERQLARMQDEALAGFTNDRLAMMHGGDMPETLAVIGQPLGMIRTGMESQADLSMGLMQANPAPRATDVRLPEGVSAYVAGGYLDGRSAPMPNLLFGTRDDLTGWYVAAGIENQISDTTAAGGSLAYSHGTGDVAIGDRASSDLFQLSFYGTQRLSGGAFVNAVVSGGLIQTHTYRHYTLGTAKADLRNQEDAPILSGELTLGYDLGRGGLKITPMVGVRSSHLGFDGGTESGGLGSLTYASQDFDTVQGRAGLSLGGNWGAIRPHVEASYVHDFLNRDNGVLAYFSGASGAAATYAFFPTVRRDQNWGEVSGGLTIGGRRVDLGFTASSVFDRKDLSYQTYRGTLTFHF